jgi:hypothetical protein
VTYDHWKATEPPEPDNREHCSACDRWFEPREHNGCDECGGPECECSCPAGMREKGGEG